MLIIIKMSEVKLKRGRPKKPEIIENETKEIIKEAINNEEIVKKGRGRPKKVDTNEEVITPKQELKRGRGRPKKVDEETEDLKKDVTDENNKDVKRGRGRPRKNSIDLQNKKTYENLKDYMRRYQSEHRDKIKQTSLKHNKKYRDCYRFVKDCVENNLLSSLPELAAEAKTLIY